MRFARLIPLLLAATLLSLSAAAGAAPSAVLGWEQHLLPPGTTVQSITYGNGRFVGVGGLGAIVASEDGQAWRQVHQEPVLRIPGVGAYPGWMEPNLNAVAYGGGRFVAVGKPWFLVLTSDDGETWRYSYQWNGERNNGSRALVDVIYANGRFVAIGNESAAGLNSYALTSADGVAWSQSDVFAGVTLTNVAWDGSRFVAFGGAENWERTAVYASADGLAWRPVDPSLQPMRSAVYNEGRYLALGQGPEEEVIYLSADGATWERRPLPVDFLVARVEAAHGFFFLLGAGPRLAFSSDGEHWVTAETPMEVETIFGAAGRLVAAGAGAERAILSLSPCGRFIDLPGTAPSCGPVTELEASQVIAGYPDGSFRPDAPVSRAEMAKLLTLVLGWPPLPAAPPAFADSAQHWAAGQGYIQAAESAGAITGYPDGTFRPDGQVTRAELLQMAARAAGLTEGAQSAAYADLLPADWFAGPVNGAVQAGLIGPGAATPLWGGPKLEPHRQVTRAEAAILLSNLNEKRKETKRQRPVGAAASLCGRPMGGSSGSPPGARGPWS